MRTFKNLLLPRWARLGWSGLLLLVGLMVGGLAHAQNEPIAFPLAKQPLYYGGAIAPLVMLDVSRDQQLYFKAYNDYTDYNGTGNIDITYNHGFDYYGYFDSYKCYTYNATTGRFEPNSYTAKTGSDGSTAANLTAKLCGGSKGWSGNFLNWVAMSRIDVVRKLLYGGYRSQDTAATTTLERSLIPSDDHAWAKYYNGIDGDALHPHLDQLTPFTTSSFNRYTSSATSTSSNKITSGSKTFTVSLARVRPGDQVVATTTTDGSVLQGTVTSSSGTSVTISVTTDGVAPAGSTSTNYTKWTLTDLTQTGMTFCNVTVASSGGSETLSTTTYPPQIRVARGNYALWAVNDGGHQCGWSDETSGSTVNGNISAVSGIYANTNKPTSTTDGLKDPQSAAGPNLIARVQACATGLIGSENCKTYPTATKPIGLLQTYGEAGVIKFGLMTGTYTMNRDGGVLRKNIGTLSDEIDPSTGAFLLQAAGNQGIINTLNRLRVYGFDYTNNNYSSGSDNCGSAGITNPPNGQCSSWGNPMGEIFSESIRYLAKQTANSTFTNSGSLSKDTTLGLPLATWTDPMAGQPYCAALNVLAFSSSANSYDDNLVQGLQSTSTIASLTNDIGVREGIDGQQAIVGQTTADTSQVCSPKTINGLSNAKGLCPESPASLGTYLIAGSAREAHQAPIRTDITIPTNDLTSLRVNTYGIQLSTSTPKISVPIPGTNPTRYVVIEPAFRCLSGTNNTTNYCGPGQIGDFKIVSQSADKSSGKFFVVWDDAQQGNDYDLDIWGTIQYQFLPAGSSKPTSLQITSQIVYAQQGFSSAFGYVLAGTTSSDGVHFPAGNKGSSGYSLKYPPTCSGSSCEVDLTSASSNSCANSPRASTCTAVATYDVSNPSTVVNLQDPLWYAAKWGGFKVLSGTNGNLPLLQSQWDSQLSNGQTGSDGIPDTYYFVTNPAALANSLNAAILKILSASSAASVATNTAQFSTDTALFQARFNGTEWTGQLLKFETDNTTGAVATTPDWDSGQVINSQDWSTGRQIITARRPLAGTTGATVGIPFRWPANSAAPTAQEMYPWQVTALNQDATATTDGQGSLRVRWMRGDASAEGTSSTSLRRRTISKLGDLINSFPLYVGTPSSSYADAAFLSFRSTYASRPAMIYVGGGDGMLHAFSADTGQEVLAFVPSSVYPKLSQLMRQDYQGNHIYTVDGSPVTGEVLYNSAWHTVLLAGLNAGAKEIFALNVSNPSTDSTKPDPAFLESQAANLLLWEFASQNTGGGTLDTNGNPTGTVNGDSDLGYTFGKPLIVEANTGKWVAIFGNGYNNTDALGGNPSTTGYAALYVVDIQTGALVRKIPVPVGTVAIPNGLGAPRSVDTNLDGMVDTVYAGDLRGNVWKFDLSSSDPTKWAIAYSGRPLFTAATTGGVPRPITGELRISDHPAGGYEILFGTGRYIGAGTTDMKASYGAADVDSLFSIRDAGYPITAGKSALLQQTLTTGATTASGTTAVFLSSNAQSFCTPGQTGGASAGCYQGCYVDLTGYPASGANGERFVYYPQITSGVASFNTIIPDGAQCSGGGTSRVLSMDYLSCGALPYPIYDITGTGTFDSSQAMTVNGVTQYPSGMLTQGLTPPGTRVYDTSTGDTRVYQSTSLGTDPTLLLMKLRSSTGRISWRELTNKK